MQLHSDKEELHFLFPRISIRLTFTKILAPPVTPVAMKNSLTKLHQKLYQRPAIALCRRSIMVSQTEMVRT
jgi:hypothetical protein